MNAFLRTAPGRQSGAHAAPAGALSLPTTGVTGTVATPRLRSVPGGLAVNALSMRYPNGHTALKHIDLEVAPGELIAVLGANGCGKSTLMKCVVGLLQPTSGHIHVAGQDLAALSGEALRVARLPVALISQHANLVKRRSVLANVCTGSLGRHRTWTTALGRLPREEITPALAYLDEVGLLHLAAQRAGTLSGGQAQRVAVARALTQRPQVLLADEPLASLDPEAADEVMRLLQRLAREEGLAVICVLHQPELAQRYADRLIGLHRGEVAFDAPAARVDNAQIANLYRSEAR
ncbi:phosphonate ABC transporter ATP-binding protein [Robbsia sp. KACC 23696]|uniref:phosphonate ABC transporter ATP-binding protein n=1 Tax=Robbsia sp. KACC 23696 TaxID=3149231 RepID=UPI00325B9460